MLGGIAFQFGVFLIPRQFLLHKWLFEPVIIIIFSALALDFTQRYFRHTPARPKAHQYPDVRGPHTPRLKTMLAALTFSTTVLFIR